MTAAQAFPIPGLGTVSIERFPEINDANVTITLDSAYDGDLQDINRQDPHQALDRAIKGRGVDDRELLELLHIALKSPGPDNQLVSCNVRTARDNPALLRFMEVLDHWDHTGDGVPDCDHIMHAIDTALPETDEQPKPFKRPASRWYTGLVMSIMPSAPERHITFGFGRLQPRFRWYHHVLALPMLAGVLGLILLQERFLPWTKYSVLSGMSAATKDLGVPWWLGFIVLMAAYIFITRRGKSIGGSYSPLTYGFFNKAAVYEEQAFREGSEDWNFNQRLRSCLAFGAIHLVNLWYPLATILPLAFGGGLFMFFYLRKYRQECGSSREVLGTMHVRRVAVLESSIWHRVYNRMALAAVVISLLLWAGTSLLVVFGLGAVMMLTADLVHQHKKYAHGKAHVTTLQGRLDALHS